MPEDNMHRDAHRDTNPETTPEPEDEAPETPLEDLIRDAYANDELVQAIIKAVNEGLPRLPAADQRNQRAREGDAPPCLL
jgi:hypothetical protein